MITLRAVFPRDASPIRKHRVDRAMEPLIVAAVHRHRQCVAAGAMSARRLDQAPDASCSQGALSQASRGRESLGLSKGLGRAGRAGPTLEGT